MDESKDQLKNEAVRKLVADIRGRTSWYTASTWPNAALNVIDCVLSLRADYKRVVLPRVEGFREKRPEIETLRSLQGLIESYDTPYDFGFKELNYQGKARMPILLNVTKRLIAQKPDEAQLSAWAESARLGGERDFGVHGFGPAGFQYLRILFGAQTFKPDMHILAQIADVTGLYPEPNEAVELLQKAVLETGVSARDLDHTIWRERSGAKSITP